MAKKIVNCEIKEGRWENSIIATFDDGTEGEVLKYYPDEISFSEDELIGLSVEEALQLKTDKDIEYLRS